MLLRLGSAVCLVFVGLGLFAHAQKTISVPSAGIATVQAGIDAASSGDTVLVAPGTYKENLIINGKEITLQAQLSAAQTILDGQNLGSVITVENTTSLKTAISGFTIQHGGSTTLTAAAGVLITSAGASVRANTFVANAIGAAVFNGSISFTGNTVQATSVIASPGQCVGGSGIYLSGPTSIVSNGFSPVSLILANTFTGVASPACVVGVGIVADDVVALEVSTNTLQNFGIGISTSGMPIRTVIQGNLIRNNAAGGIYIHHTDLSPPAGPPDTHILNNTVVNNLAGASTSHNPAPYAELAVTGTYARVEVLNNIFSTNSSYPIVDCAPPSTSALSALMVLDHNIFWNPGGPVGAESCPSQVGTYGNLNADPKFAGAADFHLSASSPGIDAGSNSPLDPVLSDLDGNPRNQDAAGKGYSVVDLGAYEASGMTKGPFSLMSVGSTSYYLTGSGSITLTAQMYAGTAPGFAAQATTPITITQTGPSSTTYPVISDASGNASVPVSLTVPGVYAFTATYAGSTLAPATSAVTYVVVAKPATQTYTTLTLTSSQSPSFSQQPVTFTMTLTSGDGTHAGPVVLEDGTTVLATLNPDAAGVATYTTSSLSIGFHPMTASFAGDSTHTPATATLTQTVLGIPTTVTASDAPNPSVYGQPVIFTTHVTPSISSAGVPTGFAQFIFCHGATVRVALDATGSATFTSPMGNQIPEPVGSCPFYVTYQPNSPFLTSTSAFVDYVVNPSTSATTVTGSPNPGYNNHLVTFTVHIAGTPAPTLSPTGAILPPGADGATGMVQIFDGSKALGSSAVDATNNATFATSALTVGSHSITAVYSGDVNLYGSTSAPYTENILPSDFVLSVNPTTLTVQTEHHGSVTLQISSTTGWTGMVQLGCGLLPVYATCELAQKSVTLGNSGSVSTTLTIDTDAVLGFKSSLAPAQPSPWTRSGLVLAGLLFPLALFSVRRRRGVFVCLVLVAGLMSLVSLGGCSGKYPGHTPPGTYVIPVTGVGILTGTGVSSTQTANVTLVVTP